MKKVQKFACSAIALLLSACANTQINTKYQAIADVPKVSENVLSQIQQCFKEKLENPLIGRENVGVVIMVNDVADGTIPLKNVNGPLADSGKMQMIKSLFALSNHEANHTLLINRVPDIFQRNNLPGNNSLISLFGYPDEGFLANYHEEMLNRFFNNPSKQNSKLYRKKDAIQYFMIDAAFSRYDTEGSLKGYGSSTQYDKNTDVNLEFGNKKLQRYMGLTINVIDPSKNLVMEAENFELALLQDDSSKLFKVGRKGFISSGLTIQNQKINSPHEAQQILIDYAAMWFMRRIYQNDFSQCDALAKQKSSTLHKGDSNV